ncbi:MAG: UDP-N-acetylmuramate dehydrogenase [Candidatus Electrothrix sp. YB6]
MNPQQRERLAAGRQGRVQFDVPMGQYSTLRTGGRAGAFLDVHTRAELQSLLVLLQEEQLAFRVIGRGSNILVRDSGYPGVILRLQGEFDHIEIPEVAGEKKMIRAGAGCSLARLLSWCSGQGLAGLEFMAGIPGSIGGAVRMNAGAWGQEIGEQLRAVEVIDPQGNMQEISAAGLRPAYRRLELAAGKTDRVIFISATFSLIRDAEETIRARRSEYLGRRKGKQPAGVASAGSFFKNPPDDSAGRLIEAAGLKGLRCGAAMVSPVHANFIVNTGQAAATDILLLMEQVQDEVFRQFAVRLTPEVDVL